MRTTLQLAFALGLLHAWVAPVAAATSDPAAQVPVDGALTFEDAAVARGELSFGGQEYWHAHWQAAGERLEFGGFDFRGDRVGVEYHVRTIVSDEVQSKTPKNIHPFVPETLHQVTLDLALVPSPQEVLVAGFTQPPPEVEAWRTSDWALTTAPAGTEVAQQPYGRLSTEVGYLNKPNVRLDGEAEALRGQVEKVYLYGYNVTLHHRDGADKLYRTGLWNETVDTPLGGVGAGIVQREGVLVLVPNNGSIEILQPSRPTRLYAPLVTFDGDLEFARASGRLGLDREERTLEDEPLDLRGTFAVQGAKSDGPGHAVGVQGRAAVQAASAVPSSSPWGLSAPVAVAAGAGLVVLAALGLYLYTRLHSDELLHQPERARIHHAVEANPGITVESLAEITGLHRNTVRYHLDVLRRHGRLRVYRTDHSWRHVLAGVDFAAARRASLLQADPKVAELLEFVGVNPCPAARAVEHVQARWGLSRSKAWEVINRAAAVELVTKEPVGRRVVLRAAAAETRSATIGPA